MRMRVLVGVLVALAGLGLMLSSSMLGEATQRSNAAFTKGRAFAGHGWATYNRVVYCVVGAAFMLGGTSYALGLG